MTAMERIEVLEKRVADLERQLADLRGVFLRPFDWGRQPTSGDPLPPYPVNIT